MESSWEPESEWDTESLWDTEEPFNLEQIKGGVGQGKRHRSLYQYVGWLTKQGKSKEEIEEIILAWNARNRPPIPKEEIKAKLDWCWNQWAPK